MFASFNDDGNSVLAIQIFKLKRIKSAKISELPLVILVGISLSCVGFDVDKSLFLSKHFFYQKIQGQNMILNYIFYLLQE